MGSTFIKIATRLPITETIAATIYCLFAWKWVVNYNELTPLYKMKNTEKEEIVGPSNVKSLVFEI